jgi:transcriptional regulator with PAS, ATPase and Fis domain
MAPLAADADSFLTTRAPELRRVVERACQVAPTPYPVLLEGETGTGKELFARGIHARSGRSGAFVPLNCSAIPENLFEVELFGARRGAYTGLVAERDGLLVAADAGTLFLDEVGDLPLSTQAKLLRVLQDGEVRPLGGNKAVRVDVRIIGATHRSLARLVDDRLFREDLFYRLSAAHLQLLPLRQRRDDIPLLVDELIAEAAAVQSVPPPKLSDAAMQLILQYSWPGNVRELRHTIAAGVLAARDGIVRAEDLPFVSGRLHESAAPGISERPFFEALAEFERAYLGDLLRRAARNVSHAAKLAGLSRAALRNKARQYGLLGEPPAKPRARSRVRRRR